MKRNGAPRKIAFCKDRTAFCAGSRLRAYMPRGALR